MHRTCNLRIMESWMLKTHPKCCQRLHQKVAALKDIRYPLGVLNQVIFVDTQTTLQVCLLRCATVVLSKFDLTLAVDECQLNPSSKGFDFESNNLWLKFAVVCKRGPFPASEYCITMFWCGKSDESKDTSDQTSLYFAKKSFGVPSWRRCERNQQLVMPVNQKSLLCP